MATTVKVMSEQKRARYSEVAPSRTAQVRVQTTGGHHERRSTRQTLDSQAQVRVGD